MRAYLYGSCYGYTMSTMLASADIIGRLRMVRLIRRMSTQDVANGCGIARSVLANMESGRRASITVDEVRFICNVLDVDPLAIMSTQPLSMLVES